MHDHPLHRHTIPVAANVAPSLLRASVTQRLAVAALFAAVLWLAVGWALDIWTTGAAS